MQVRVLQKVYIHNGLFDWPQVIELEEGDTITPGVFEPVNKEDQAEFDAGCESFHELRKDRVASRVKVVNQAKVAETEILATAMSKAMREDRLAEKAEAEAEANPPKKKAAKKTATTT